MLITCCRIKSAKRQLSNAFGLIKNIMRYYVNKNAQPNGDHEVHTSTCNWIPNSENRIYLGEFLFCSSAVSEARRYFKQCNGCYYCANACHTS